MTDGSNRGEAVKCLQCVAMGVLVTVAGCASDPAPKVSCSGPWTEIGGDAQAEAGTPSASGGEKQRVNPAPAQAGAPVPAVAPVQTGAPAQSSAPAQPAGAGRGA